MTITEQQKLKSFYIHLDLNINTYHSTQTNNVKTLKQNVIIFTNSKHKQILICK